MKAGIAKLLIWLRLLSPMIIYRIVVIAWGACEDGKVTSAEVARIIEAMDFEVRVPFVRWFRTVP